MIKYEDMLHLPHPVSAKHPPMPQTNRAAQFMPFAALSGYEEALAETARLTDPRIEPDPEQRELLNRRLALLQSLAAQAAPPKGCAGPPGTACTVSAAADSSARPQITVTYFRPDAKKEGGSYLSASGRFCRVDIPSQLLYLETASTHPAEKPGELLVIPLADLLCITGDCFREPLF